jgi:hypothetical protein
MTALFAVAMVYGLSAAGILALLAIGVLIERRAFAALFRAWRARRREWRRWYASVRAAHSCPPPPESIAP